MINFYRANPALFRRGLFLSIVLLGTGGRSHQNYSQDTFNWVKRFNLIYTTFAAIGFSPISPRYSLSIKDSLCVSL